MQAQPDDATPQPARGGLRAFDRLLTRPQSLLEEDGGGSSAPLWLLAGGLVGFVIYGAAAGCFQGGAQVLVSAFKAPLIAGLALALCLPSLYVFSALSGARWSRRRLLAAVAGFVGTLGILLAALLPVSWLFSVSSRYLASAVWIHVILWLVSLVFGWRFLGRSLRESGAGGGMFLWLALFALVSLQVATFLRPVLWRDPGQPLFERGKMFFLEHFGEVLDQDEAARHPKTAQPGR
jgi:hypothetical protein